MVKIILAILLFPTLLLADNVKTKIGVPVPLTGEASSYGLDMKDAYLFANEVLANNAYDLIFEDSKCNGRDAVTAAQKLINIDKVKYVIGFACSGETIPALPLYEKAKIPAMVTGASSPKIAYSGDYVFRTFPNDKIASKRLYDYVKEHHKSFGIISEETDYAQDFLNAFTAANTNDSVKIYTESYLPNTTDFRTIITLMRSKNPDGLFINSQTEQGFALIAKQIKDFNWSIPFYGAYWPSSPTLLKKVNIGGTIFVDLPTLDAVLNDEGKSVHKEFLKKYGNQRSIETLFASSFEGFRALHLAISSGEDIRKFLYSTKFSGVFGPYSFDKQGEIEGLGVSLKTIKDNKAVELK